MILQWKKSENLGDVEEVKKYYRKEDEIAKEEDEVYPEKHQVISKGDQSNHIDSQVDDLQNEANKEKKYYRK